MGYYNNKGHFYSEEKSLEHRAKYGTANSVTNEKGTDGKKNNSSSYNHDYYVKNKAKWKNNKKEYSKDDKDFDESNYSDENWVKDTDFYAKKNPDGTYTVLLEDSKWTLPADADINSIKSQLQEAAKMENVKERSAKYDRILSGASDDNDKEFDVEAAAKDVIKGKYKNGAERKAALGDDYEAVQKKVNELMKKGGGSGKKDESSSKTEDNKSDKKTRTFAEAATDYYQEKGKKRTEELKKKKAVKHFDKDGAIIRYYDGRY